MVARAIESKTLIFPTFDRSQPNDRQPASECAAGPVIRCDLPFIRLDFPKRFTGRAETPEFARSTMTDEWFNLSSAKMFGELFPFAGSAVSRQSAVLTSALLAKLHTANYAALVRHCEVKGFDHYLAEDAVATVFLRLSKRIGSPSWIVGIDADVATDALKLSVHRQCIVLRFRKKSPVQYVGFVEGPVDPKTVPGLKSDLSPFLWDICERAFSAWGARLGSPILSEAMRKVLFEGAKARDLLPTLDISESMFSRHRSDCIAFIKRQIDREFR